ncbi:3-ketoacyl-CoA synthase 9 [Dichanthelium oligosanthes]|uniref:very-long-chain 3-oxoacyl-CoA synthase n=1 Tax=Dichanthelium oligosanthes TaxID=888268 RepID=A0A1E5WE40_9POAL|nr:3-ketoacyl-CoA synthase 9 [Dichanthelium oligosanthes]
MPYLIDEESVSYGIRLLERSGLGEETCVPEVYHYMPVDQSLRASRDEAELVIFSAIDDAFSRTSVEPAEIGVLIVNCSVFAPTPVLDDMVVNRYKLRPDVQSVNLSGMGCSAALVSVGLAKNLLQVAPAGTHVLFVATEILSSHFYAGMGAAAIILSNSPERARFKLGRVVRTVHSAKRRLPPPRPATFGAAPGRALLDQAEAAARARKGGGALPPRFPHGVRAICIHAGWRAVVNEVQRGLGLSDEDVDASRMTLHRFGNTSSSLVLYELAYIEAKGRMKRGDRVWMISFGDGFDCNSVAWECLRPAADADGPWVDCNHRYPVKIPEIVKGI